MSTPAPPPPSRPTKRRHQLFEHPPSYWRQGVQSSASFSSTIILAEQPSQASSSSSQINSDFHRFNAKRAAAGKQPVSGEEFDRILENASLDSLSASESESDAEEGKVERGSELSKQRLSFPSPFVEGEFIVMHKVALPDMQSLASLERRGSWAVIMSSGGHFVAALWDINGVLKRHKTFHRYTSRRKQGGSQAAADEARGNANRIRSAGATLRRHGEQALRQEVHELLKEWYDDLVAAQCVFIRAGQREKRDLLVGWEGSPLQKVKDDSNLRNIPIATRRPTLSEAKRIHRELSTYLTVDAAFVAEQTPVQKEASKLKPPKPQPATVKPSQPAVKGTDHLKKRDPDEKKERNVEPQPEEPVVDEELASLLKYCLSLDKDMVNSAFERNSSRRTATLDKHYFKGDLRFDSIEMPIGLVAVAAVVGSPEFVEWLLDNNVPPTEGTSPYLVTKSKAVRNGLRIYWEKNPERYDYAAAGIPAPLSKAEQEAAVESGRARRKRDRLKKKEKALQRVEDAKPLDQKARELRAMAAEARLLGNRCALCKKSLVGLTPFSRLAYKYCSTDCVNKHRVQLTKM